MENRTNKYQKDSQDWTFQADSGFIILVLLHSFQSSWRLAALIIETTIVKMVIRGFGEKHTMKINNNKWC